MKRILFFGFLLTLLLGFSLDASALAVTFEWDTPGTIKIQRDSQVGPWIDLSPDQTSYTATTSGWIYLYSIDGYRVTGAQTANGDKLEARTNANGIYVGLFLGDSADGRVYKVSVEKVERNQSFTVDLVNGAAYVTAKFNSGYTLDLKEGTHSYNIDPELDKTLTLSLSDISSAYQVKLNGTDIEKNYFYPKYENINIKPGDTLFIQVFEKSEPKDCTVTLQYGEGMEGCLYNIYNRTTGVFVQPDELVNNSLIVKENTELRVNFVGEDYTITKLLLNGTDVTSSYANNSIAFFVTDPNTTLQIDGKAKEYANINFTGYIVNADCVNFSLSYQGSPFALPQGTEVSKDIEIDDSLTMPAGETKKYVIPISEKNGKFFFSPKTGYYISNIYTLTPEGSLELHSGSASISAKIDGTTFYMMVEKLPESYTADMNVKGNDFNLRISASSALSDSWNNPSPPSYSPAEGERVISFIPGYGTPIVFGFVGDESQHPAVYLDGAEETGTVNSNSGAIEYFITPYSPSDNSGAASDVHSTIDVYNSFKERPQLSGASLELEGEAEAEFFYSPVLHKANPDGQVVISGTQFTVRPASPEMIVTYKGQPVQLNDKGEYVFNATGNARNNIVKVSPAPEAPAYSISPADGSKVNNLSQITVTFPNAKVVEYNEIGIVLNGPETNFSSTDVHGSANIWTVTFHNPSVSGKYSITFPAGAFTLDGVESLEISAEYDFETGWEILPAPGSTVESLNEIVLSFPQATTVEFVGEFYSFVLSNGNNFAAPGYNCTRDESAAVPTFRLTLPAGVIPPIGSYTFTIEEGAFNVDGDPSAEIFVTYIIDRESSTEYYQTPERTIVYQDYGYDFAIIFEEGTTVGRSLDSSKVKLTFNGESLTANDYMSAAEANMLMFMVTNPDYIKEGLIKLEIEEGAFMLGSTPSPAISAEWDVVAPKTFEAEITTKNQLDDKGKVSDLSEIYVFFPEAKSGEIFQASGAQLRSQDYSYSQSGKITIDSNTTSGVKFVITFDPAPTVFGQYSLSINEGTFTLDGTFASPDIEQTFYFEKGSDVVSVYGDALGMVTVLTLDGKVILDKAPAEQLRSLEKGIYIVNGKKTLVK